MNALFLSLLMLLLAVVFIQDMKYRAVSWILFPLIFLVSGAYNWMELTGEDVLFNAGSNLMALLSIFTFVTVYFSVKAGKLVNISESMIGWGDLLFLICLTVLMSPVNFILFFTGSLLIITLVAGIVAFISKNKNIQVPLAGLQALMLMGLLCFAWLFPVFRINTDTWILAVF